MPTCCCKYQEDVPGLRRSVWTLLYGNHAALARLVNNSFFANCEERSNRNSSGGGTMIGSGNSFAAPHITGLAALLRGQHPELTTFELKAVLAATATRVGASAVASKTSKGDRS